jgi:hypothetical protein
MTAWTAPISPKAAKNKLKTERVYLPSPIPAATGIATQWGDSTQTLSYTSRRQTAATRRPKTTRQSTRRTSSANSSINMHMD